MEARSDQHSNEPFRALSRFSTVRSAHVVVEIKGVGPVGMGAVWGTPSPFQDRPKIYLSTCVLPGLPFRRDWIPLIINLAHRDPLPVVTLRYGPMRPQKFEA